MQATVRYGREERPIVLPDGAAVIAARKAEPLSETALKEKLLALVPPGRRLGILLPDRTRPLPVGAMLDWLLPELDGREVTLFIGTGIHRPMTAGEVAAHVGEAGARCRVVANTPDDPAAYASLGPTSRGTPVELLKEAMIQDALLGLTLVRPHYYAGFSGGRKVFVPGIASRRCIQGNHSLVLDPDPAKGKHPRAVLGVLEGNPVAQDMMEAAGRVPVPYALAHCLMQEGRLLDLLPAFGPAVERVRALCEAPVPVGGYDALVVSAGGHPYDTDFIQGHKALENAVGGLRPGGALYAHIAAPEGFGSPDGLEFLKLGAAGAAARLREAFKVYGHTALAILLKGRKFDIRLHSALPEEHVRLMGFTPWDGILPAGLPVRTAFMPQGGSVYFPQ
jgi:nickel-dependent lactate racemase